MTHNMKRFFKLILASIAVLTALTGCKTSSKTLLPNISGKAGEVIVVIDRENWEGELGNEVRLLLADDCPWLAQKEPLYTLVNVNPNAFIDMFKVHRNIVYFDINPQVATEGVTYRADMWAAPQCVIQISAATSENAVELMKNEGETIVAVIEQAERDRVIANSRRYEERSLAPQVMEIMGGTPHFPSGYKLKKKTDNFIWIADEKQYTNQGVFIYKYPVTEAEPFSLDNIIRHRNQFLKENVPGMFDGTYMITADYIPPTVSYLQYKGRSFAQCRGFWEVYNDFMGGPFVSHSFYSQDGKDVIVLEAFVYAPKYDKRQYLRQVESILYSFEWESAKE